MDYAFQQHERFGGSVWRARCGRKVFHLSSLGNSDVVYTIERIALYFAYLAQNILNGDNEDLDKIAAGCPGERGRCTFNEFVEFLWKPDKDGTFQRPTANFVGDQDDFVREATRNYNPLFQEINRYADVETGGHFTGSTDTQKIWLGATDWYDAMGRKAHLIRDRNVSTS